MCVHGVNVCGGELLHSHSTCRLSPSENVYSHVAILWSVTGTEIQCVYDEQQSALHVILPIAVITQVLMVVKQMSDD